MEKKEEKKKNGEIPHTNSLCVRLLEPEDEDLSWSSVCADVHFQVLDCNEFKLEDTRYTQKVNPLPVWWYFKFWSSPICLLLFTFSSPQTVVPYSCPDFISYFPWKTGCIKCAYFILLKIRNKRKAFSTFRFPGFTPDLQALKGELGSGEQNVDFWKAPKEMLMHNCCGEPFLRIWSTSYR